MDQALIVVRFAGLAGQGCAFGHIGVSERTTHRVARLLVPHGLEESPADDLEGFFGGDRLPQRLHPPEGLFHRPKRLGAAVADFHFGLRQRRQQDGVGNQLNRLGERLNEG